MQVDAVQLGALGAGHIVGGVVVGQAGSLDIGGNQGFFKALQVDHVKILAVQEFVRAQVEHAVGVDAQDVVRRLDVDGLRPSGQVEMPLAVDVGGKGIAAGDGFALRHRKGGGEQAQRQQHDEQCCFLHGPVLLMMIVLRRAPKSHGSPGAGAAIMGASKKRSSPSGG